MKKSSILLLRVNIVSAFILVIFFYADNICNFIGFSSLSNVVRLFCVLLIVLIVVGGFGRALSGREMIRLFNKGE
jgi:hypothetical protein